MPVSTQRLTASQFRPEDRQRLNINRGDRIDMRTTPAGDGVELFVNGRQRHEVRALEMSVQDMYFRVAYEQARADDARIEAAAAQIRRQTDDELLAALAEPVTNGATASINSMTAEQARNALRTLAGDIGAGTTRAVPMAEWARSAPPPRIENVGTSDSPDLRVTIPRGELGSNMFSARLNAERWVVPTPRSSGTRVVAEIESEIADLRRHGYEPKVIAVDPSVMSYLRGSTAFQWQHQMQAMPLNVTNEEHDDVFGESRVQVEGTLFGIRLVEDDRTEGYVIAVKR